MAFLLQRSSGNMGDKRETVGSGALGKNESMFRLLHEMEKDGAPGASCDTVCSIINTSGWFQVWQNEIKSGVMFKKANLSSTNILWSLFAKQLLISTKYIKKTSRNPSLDCTHFKFCSISIITTQTNMEILWFDHMVKIGVGLAIYQGVITCYHGDAWLFTMINYL